MSPSLGQDDKARFSTLPQPATPVANHGPGYATFQAGTVHGYGGNTGPLETPHRYQTGPVVSQHGSPFYPGQHHPVFAAGHDAANIAAYHYYMMPAHAPPALAISHYGSPPATPQAGASYVHHPEYQTYTPPYIHAQNFTHLTPPSSVPQLDYRRGSGASFVSTGSPPTPQNTDASPHARIVHGLTSISLNGSPEHHHGAQDLFGAKKAYSAMNSPVAPSIYPQSIEDRLEIIHHENGEQINTNVYIRGLPAEIDDDKLYEMTSIYGPIVSHKAIIDTENGGCKG